MAGWIETIEGFAGDGLWYHYDVPNDVLYLRLWSNRDTPVVGEETEEAILLRDDQTDEPVGLTYVHWWKRFFEGPLPDSLSEITTKIEPFGQRLKTAA